MGEIDVSARRIHRKLDELHKRLSKAPTISEFIAIVISVPLVILGIASWVWLFL